MEFENTGYFLIPLGFGQHLVFNDTVFSTLIIGLLLCAFAVVVRVKLKNFKDKPEGGFQNIVETMVEVMHNFTISNMGERFAYFGNWFFGVFAFILLSNWGPLFMLRPPTADLACTLVFGLTTWLMIMYMAITKMKGEFVKELMQPLFVFLPMNLVGEISPLISLSFRLFGNILGGIIIMGLIYELFPWFFKLGIPSALHIYFDVFVGALQAYIFVMLSMAFIKNKTGHAE